MASSTDLAFDPQSGQRGSKNIAPYGLWESEITKEAVFSTTWNLNSPRVDRRTGRAFFTESRSDGISYIRELRNGECHDVLPAGYNARSRVYEYGGDPFAILSGEQVIFSNFSDNSVNILNVDSGNVKRLIHKDVLRYAAYNAHPGDQPWVIAVEEDHSIDTPENVKNYLVAINTETGEVKRIAAGADFYMYPGFSYDGKKVCWVEWNFPDMPWSGVKLYWADFKEDGTLDNIELVAGDNRMSVTEPRWGPDGYLYFCQEQTNFRQIYRRQPGDEKGTLLKLPGFEKVEFGLALMFCGGHSYAILSKDCLVAMYTDNGANRLIKINLQTMEFSKMPLSVTDVTSDGIDRLSDSSFLLIGSGATNAQALRIVDITSDGAKETIVRQSTDQYFSKSLFSSPEHIEFPAKKGTKRTVHGFFWPPHNPQYQGPDGQKAPLVVLPHGGPTAHTTPGMKLPLQYWSSRGYAQFAINYSGSSGHGKEYRELLNGNWGVIDVDDVAESVQYLAETGRVDGSKVGIKGGSAGGYSVLQALCCYPEIFASGVDMYGISEVKLLLGTTHKMESQYVDMLMFTDDMTEKDREKVMYDRSPVYHAGNITAPLLILHGEEDKVVPISQAYVLYDDIKKRGGEVKLIKFKGEGHGFRLGKNLLKALEEEEEWWKKTLVRY